MNHDMTFFGKRVLFIGAHPDDIELGAGALISHISAQTQILSVTLSDNQKNPDLINVVQEHQQAMHVLGVNIEDLIVGQFETRQFQSTRQEILEYLINIQKEFEPEIVFTHSRADLHQDHSTVTEETLRAFRGTTILGFDVIRSSYGFFPNFLVEIDESDVEKKIEALTKYRTYSTKYYFNPNLTRATLIRNGALTERPYAEGFDILRIIGKFGKEH